ncbi:MAG: hypothetical protein ACTHJ4_03400 [Candidatus Nucleicultricaceae bacterium]
MKLNKTVSLALATALLLNTTTPAFANSMFDTTESISWTARAKKLAGLDVTQYADEKARAISAHAGKAVRNKVHEIFFKDNDRYGVDADGRHVTIFTNKSGLLNNLFKKVTGADLDESLRSVLPLGGLYVNTLRQKLDKAIVDEILGSLVSLGVEEIIYRSITGAYSIGTQKLEDMTSNFMQSVNSKPKSDAQASLEHTYATVKQSKLDIVDVKDDAQDEVKATAAKILTDENDDEITLNKVVSYYKNKFLSYIDTMLKDTMISAISSAAKMVGTKVADATVNMIKGPSTVSGALVGWFVNPTVGLVTGLTGFVTGLYQEQIRDYAGTQAEARARKVANKALQSKQLIGHQKTITSKTQMIDDMEFEVLDEIDHSISAWAAQKMQKVTSTLQTIKETAEKAQQKVVETAVAMGHALAEVDVKGGVKQAAQYANKTFGGYDPLDIKANIRPLSIEEQEIYNKADERVPFPPQSIIDRFGHLSDEQINALSGSEGEAYDDLVDAWQEEYDAEVETIKHERAQAKKAQQPQQTSMFGKVKGWFSW